MIRAFSRATAVLALAAVSTLVAAEDLTVVSNATSNGKESTVSTHYISSSKMRSSGAKVDTIVDYATGTFTIIDNNKKEYWQTTADEMNASLKQIEAQMAEMREKMKDMPPALRKAMGGAGAPVDVKVEKAGDSKKIAGYLCDHYVADMGETNKMEFWVTKDIKPPVQYYDAFKIQVASLGQAGQTMSKAYEELRKIDGYPLATSTTMKLPMGMTMASSTEATEVKKGPIPASTFEIPAGFKKTESPLQKMGKRK
jgi:hypothetical protein